MTEKKSELLRRLEAELAEKARMAAHSILDDGKKHFQKAAERITEGDEEEMDMIVSYFRSKVEFAEVWDGCPKFRAEVVDKVVSEWSQKTQKFSRGNLAN